LDILFLNIFVEGNDTFMHQYRTHNCGELRIGDVGKEVKIAGWIQNIRDLGSMTFLTLRDHYGVTQVIISDNPTLQAQVKEYSKEYTVSIRGKVNERSDKNPNMPTGDIEIIPEEITLLGKSESQLPFEIATAMEAREDLRLKYRYLDLRNDKLHSNIVLRSKIIASLRKRMTDLGFMEIQTPILTSSSPEGARDYLVPSRVHPGKFYALPQAPQQFKQLLMASGFDKYFQIAPCFRDEDARADRSPGEFYQLDMEMAFATQEDVFAIMEKVLHDVFVEFSDYKVTDVPFPRIPYKDAMLNYGSDKPDLRNPLIIKDLTEVFANTEFNAFKGKTIRAIPFADGDKQPRKFFDRMGEFAVKKGAKGLAWVKIDENGEFSGSISKFLSDDDKKAINEICGMDKCYAIFFSADELDAAVKIAGLVRNEVGAQLDLLEKDVFKFCWIVDFPMFEYDEELEKVEFSHNPFSMPQGGMDALCNMNPLEILAYQYDIVCNGIELSSGAVRNHNPEMMVKAFEIAGYDETVVRSKFPALYNAFHYGAPPHAGIAPGVDRMVMLLADEPNIREVIAFPMNKNAQDLLMGAPAVVTQKQLDEVHIKEMDIPETEEEAQ